MLKACINEDMLLKNACILQIKLSLELLNVMDILDQSTSRKYALNIADMVAGQFVVNSHGQVFLLDNADFRVLSTSLVINQGAPSSFN